jgi:Helix-turn-helix domain
MTSAPSKPFKTLDCELLKTRLLRMPPLALKIWMAHLAHEGKDKPSYPSIDTLMKICDINKEDTVYKWRAWLVTNEWLVKIGEIAPRRKGEFAVPMFSCKSDGTVPHQTGDGKKGHRTPPNGGRTHPIKRGTDAPRQTGVEVNPIIQVDKSIQVGSGSKTSEKNLTAKYTDYIQTSAPALPSISGASDPSKNINTKSSGNPELDRLRAAVAKRKGTPYESTPRGVRIREELALLEQIEAQPNSPKAGSCAQ